MEPVRARILDEELSFLHSNLIVDETLFSLLLKESVFSSEMLDRIRTCRTDPERISEMIGLLKKRGNSAFDKFVNALVETQQEHVAEHLQNCQFHVLTIRAADRSRSKIRTMTDSGNFGGGPSQSDVGGGLVGDLEDVDVFDAAAATDRLLPDSDNNNINNNNNNNNLLPDDFTREELIELLRRRDETIAKRDREYDNLKRVLDETLTDLKEGSDYIERLEAENDHLTQVVANRESARNLTTSSRRQNLVDMQQEIENKSETIRAAERRLETLQDDLAGFQARLRKATDTRRKIARELQLSESASDVELLKQLQEMKRSNAVDREKALRIEREFDRVKRERLALEENEKTLLRERDHLSFQVRQYHLEIKKLQRGTRDPFAHVYDPTGPTTARSNLVLNRIDLRLHERPATKRPPTSHLLTARPAIVDGGGDAATNTVVTPIPKLKPPRSAARSRPAFQQFAEKTRLNLPSIERSSTDRKQLRYCVLCRQEYPSNVDRTFACWVHSRPVHDGAFECCGVETDWSAGCVKVRHLYLERNAEGKFVFTDGFMRTMDAH